MSDNDLFLTYTKLKEDLSYHNYRYHVLNDPVISDAEFDQLLKQLREIEAEHPDWVTPDSPTQRAGADPLDRFEKVEHPAPILSLGNAFDEQDLRNWFERIARLDERVRQTGFTLEPKLDGLTVVLHYKDGVFVQGATRGKWRCGRRHHREPAHGQSAAPAHPGCTRCTQRSLCAGGARRGVDQQG